MMQRRSLLQTLFSPQIRPGAAASAPDNDFHFSILGDRTGSPQPQIYGRTLREIALLGPDFVVNIGDSIQGHDPARTEAEWQEVKAIWAKHLTQKQYVLVGNHDVWDERSAALYSQHTGYPLHYSFRHQNALFVMLDNSQTEELAEGELRFLEEELKRYATASPKLVFARRPFWATPLANGDASFALHGIARKHGVS